jgi:hypothetical protein
VLQFLVRVKTSRCAEDLMKDQSKSLGASLLAAVAALVPNL